MKKFRYFLMMLLTAAICAGFQSCSDDDEEDGTTYSDFYIECTNVSGGGLSSQEGAGLRASLNEELIEIVLTGMTQSEAIDVFTQFVEGMARELSGIIQPTEPLKITYELKTKATGQCVKRTTITITNGGITVS